MVQRTTTVGDHRISAEHQTTHAQHSVGNGPAALGHHGCKNALVLKKRPKLEIHIGSPNPWLVRLQYTAAYPRMRDGDWSYKLLNALEKCAEFENPVAAATSVTDSGD